MSTPKTGEKYIPSKGRFTAIAMKMRGIMRLVKYGNGCLVRWA